MTGAMSRPRPGSQPGRRSLLFCLCLLLPLHQAFIYTPQPQPQPQHPRSAAAYQPPPRIRSARAAGLSSGESVASQPLRVSMARFPLIGWPSWGPKLHVAVVVEQGDAIAASAAPAYLLFDFIPAAATEITTATSLFRGQAVPGIVREKVLTFAPPALVLQGSCCRSLEEIREFCATYDARLHLLNNNCYSFSDRLLQFLLVDDER